MRDHLGQRLAELPIPDSAETRERTVVAGRAATPAPTRQRRRRRRSAVAAGITVILGLSLVSPPGQAAIDRVSELIGIGDVGEPPTMPLQGRQPDQGFIVDNGYAPDGTGYEWAAFRDGNTYRIDGEDVRMDAFCVGLEWPDAPRRGSSRGCSTEPESSRSPFGPQYLSMFHVGWLQLRAERVRRRDVMVHGVTTREPHDMRILYTDAQGETRELPIDFTRVDGDRLKRAGGDRPFGVFTAFISAEEAHRDMLSSRFPDITLIVPDAPESFEEPESTPEACRFEPEQGPFEYVFYDRDGKVLDRVPTVVARRAPRDCVDALEKAETFDSVPPAP